MLKTQRTGTIRRRLIHAGAALLIVALTGANAFAQNLPLTGAERAEWSRHTSHEELVEFLFEVQSMTDNMLVRQLTTTAEGRGVYLVILGDPPTATPGTAWFSGKPTICLVQNVHGGELSGREGDLPPVGPTDVSSVMRSLSSVAEWTSYHPFWTLCPILGRRDPAGRDSPGTRRRRCVRCRPWQALSQP